MMHWVSGQTYISRRAGSYNLIEATDSRIQFTLYTHRGQLTEKHEFERIAVYPGSSQDRIKYVLKKEEEYVVIFVKSGENDTFLATDPWEEVYESADEAAAAKAYDGIEWSTYRPLKSGETPDILRSLEIDEYMGLYERFIAWHKSQPDRVNALKNARKKEQDIHVHIYAFSELENPGHWPFKHEFTETLKLSEIMYQRYPEVMAYSVQIADMLRG